MLSELLAALMGFEGDVFIFTDSYELKVRPGLPFVSPLEEEILNRICRVGSYYKRLDDFVLSHRDGNQGAYLGALALAMDRYLDDYRDLIAQLDELVVQGDDITLSRVQHAVGAEEGVFEMLHKQLFELEQDQIRGCAVLTRLSQATANGNPKLAEIYAALHQACQLVLLRQLAAWLSQGLLHDRHQEFFIQRRDQTSSPDQAQSTVKPVWDMYHVVLDKLPAIIPPSLATKILNTGRTVLVLRDEMQSLHAESMQFEQQAEDTVMALVDSRELKTWQLEAAIKSISYNVNEKLWRTLAQRNGLLAAMKTVKGMILLGRGELFHAFFEHSDRVLFKPVINTSEFDIRAAFNRALSDLGLQDDADMQHVQINVSNPAEGPNADTRVLPNLSLSWAWAWPTQLLFTPENLQQYNDIFRFLLRLRHVQAGLNRSWAALMGQYQRRTGVHDANSRLWMLRMQMSHLVDNLYAFLQSDVFEPAYHDVISAFEKADNFEDILTAHDGFLALLRQQTFQSMPTIMKVVNEVLRCSERLTELIDQHSDLALILTPDVTAIDQTFRRQATFLYRVLSAVKDRRLAQLLLRIDYSQQFFVRLAATPLTSADSGNAVALT